MSDRLARYETMLLRLDRKRQRRVLLQQMGVDFTSNDYLGLAASTQLNAGLISALARGVPAGAGGSRLLRGNHPEHEALEAEAAAFFGSERMLYFGSGYAANLAVLSALPQRGDLIVHDRLIHASVHAGIAVGRAASVAVPHNDVAAFDTAIRTWRKDGGKGHPWIVVESLYSMEGDRAPLSALTEVADRHDGFLLIDEAHASGVHGTGGHGFGADLEGRENVITLHTCGKALGASGALIGARRVLCDVLVNRASPLIYTTAPAPLQAAAVRAALKIVAEEPERRGRLRDLVALANARARGLPGFTGTGTQILPVIIGDNDRALRIAAHMQAAGFDIRAIRPPAVPRGNARLRIAITLNVDAPTILRMLDQLAQAIIEETA